MLRTVAARWICREISPSVTDSMIGATALVHGMTVVTRNVSDFCFEGLPVVNPFGV